MLIKQRHQPTSEGLTITKQSSEFRDAATVFTPTATVFSGLEPLTWNNARSGCFTAGRSAPLE